MIERIQGMGVTSSVVYTASFASMGLSLLMWLVGRSGGRLGTFVGLWPPTLMILGKVLEDRERQGSLGGDAQ
jgi:hypothetical protein